MSKAIGIDLGTAYSCVSVWQNGHVEIIPNNDGNRTTPSYISFSDTKRLFSDAAKRQASRNPLNSVFSMKRLIGHKFNDLGVQLESNIDYYPFKVFNKEGWPYFEVEYRGEKKELSPVEILSMVLLQIRKTAEAYLGHFVTNAVVGVPSGFNHSQRQAIKDAATIAGLCVLRTIDEPTLAAIAYGFQTNLSGEHNILVYDLGAGSCSVSLLSIDENIYEVKATTGDSNFGGEEFDNCILRHLVQEFKRKYKKTLTSNPRALYRLRMASERAKCALSSVSRTFIELDSLVEGVDFYTSLTRDRFEELCESLFLRTLEPIERVLHDSRIQKSDIHQVVLVGGSTRIPRIVNIVSNFFDGKELAKSVNPEEAVAYGAAIQATILSGDSCGKTQDHLLFDVTPFSLGIATEGQNRLRSVGSEISNGIMSTLLKRNTSVATRRGEIFSTNSDNQPSVLIQVYEGDHAHTKANKFLGQLELSGILAAPRGVPVIEVTFDLDANSVLNVKAEDKTSGKSKRITVTSPDRLSREEIERMVEEAEKFDAQDEEVRGSFIARDSLESCAYNLREKIKTMKMKMKKLEIAVDETVSWLESSEGAGKGQYVAKQKELESMALFFSL